MYQMVLKKIARDEAKEGPRRGPGSCERDAAELAAHIGGSVLPTVLRFVPQLRELNEYGSLCENSRLMARGVRRHWDVTSAPYRINICSVRGRMRGIA